MSDISRVSSEEFYVGTGKGHRLARNGVSIVTPPPIEPEVPVHRCHGATDSVIITLIDRGESFEDLWTYQAIEINGEVFNEEHYNNLFGEEHSAVYTTTTGYSVAFKVVSPVDETNPQIILKIKKHANSTDYVNIRLLPDPSANELDLYNNIQKVEGGGTITYTGINEVIEFCLKPEYKDPSKYDCDGAYGYVDFLLYNPNGVYTPSYSYAISPTKYNVTVDNVNYGVIEFTEVDPDSDGDYTHRFKSRLEIGEWVFSITTGSWGRGSIVLTNGIKGQPIHVKLEPVEPEYSGDAVKDFDKIWLDVNGMNPTANYDAVTGTMEFCLLDDTTPVQCRGATHDLELYLTKAEPIEDEWGYEHVCNYSVEFAGEVFNQDFGENIFSRYKQTSDGGLQLSIYSHYRETEPAGTGIIYAWLNVNYIDHLGTGLDIPLHVKLTPPPNATKNLITGGNTDNNSSIKVDPITGVVTFCIYGEQPS